MTAIHSFYIINKSGGLIFYKVNIHLMRMIPFDEDNIVLGHQVLCLAMLFDFFFDDGNMSSERRSTSVIDVGLCKPVSGELVTRSFRDEASRRVLHAPEEASQLSSGSCTWRFMERSFGCIAAAEHDVRFSLAI